MRFGRAIPTEYRGVQMKSRLEASCAQLLDLLGLEWEYEHQSFLMDGGVHYLPDFWIESEKLWVEPRGYDSPHGHLQAVQFEEFVKTRNEHFLFLSASACTLDGEDARVWYDKDAGRWRFSTTQGDKLSVVKSSIKIGGYDYPIVFQERKEASKTRSRRKSAKA